MATFGEIRFRLSKLFQGVDLDLIDGWLIDRYREILDTVPWSRLETVTTFQSPEEYATGTVDVTEGSATITGTGTTWTSAMSGRLIRVDGQDEYYQFTYVSATSGTLDRAYEGDTATALSYQINQNVFVLPSDARIVNGITFPYGNRTLTKKSLGELNDMAPSRNSYGEPLFWAPYMDSYTDPPVIQVELYPIPDEVWGFSAQITADDAAAAAYTPTATIAPWSQPGALLAGVSADVRRSVKEFKDLAAADRDETRFEVLVQKMIRVEAASRPPASIVMADRFTRHRVERWNDD